MLETCRGLWFSINWMKSASSWFHYTDILLCTVSETLILSSSLRLNNLLGRTFIIRYGNQWLILRKQNGLSVKLLTSTAEVHKVQNAHQFRVLSGAACRYHLSAAKQRFLTLRRLDSKWDAQIFKDLIRTTQRMPRLLKRMSFPYSTVIIRNTQTQSVIHKVSTGLYSWGIQHLLIVCPLILDFADSVSYNFGFCWQCVL
jgi:hypothetical protein